MPLAAVEIRQDDVFVVSYPKSGNTWVRFLIANLLAPKETISFRNIEKYVPDIYKSGATLQERKGRRFLKSHHPCYELYPKLIYIYRDGRDVLVSYYLYASAKKVFRGTFADFVFSSFAAKFSSWSEHVTGALDFASKHPDRILLLQYEKMLEHPLACGTSVSAFLNLGCGEQEIAIAVEKSGFTQLKIIEEKFGGENPNKPATFFRRGQSGQWREHFTPELYRQYRRANAAALLRLGYQL